MHVKYIPTYVLQLCITAHCIIHTCTCTQTYIHIPTHTHTNRTELMKDAWLKHPAISYINGFYYVLYLRIRMLIKIGSLHSCHNVVLVLYDVTYPHLLTQ